ncbi:MAG: NFACT family protein [Candidatus Micrarchaeota archaeon]
MQQLANLDCFFLAREFASLLDGSFLENFYDFGNGVFRLKFSKQSVLVDLRGFAFLSQAFPEPPRQPSSFAMLLRKHLSSSKLAGVRQPVFDRIFEFEFSNREGRKFLVVELFGKQGNLLLLDGERRIIAPFKRVSYAARSLKQGEEYKLPPSAKKHPEELQESDFHEGSSGKIVSFLSQKTSLSPFYLEEACARAGVSLESTVESLGAGEKKRILRELKSFFSEKPSPAVFLKEERPFAFSSLKLEKFSEELKGFSLVSQAVAEYYTFIPASSESGGKREGKLEFQLESQKESLARFEREALEKQSAGKWVFENHELAEEVLRAAREKDVSKLRDLEKRLSIKIRQAGVVVEMEAGG